jgi:hypothetical protein
VTVVAARTDLTPAQEDAERSDIANRLNAYGLNVWHQKDVDTDPDDVWTYWGLLPHRCRKDDLSSRYRRAYAVIHSDLPFFSSCV